jgi:hypothetical protein
MIFNSIIEHREPHLEIKVDSDTLVLRCSGGDEGEPAILSGELLVRLVERTNLKDISQVPRCQRCLSISDSWH